jgi:hypothetical protein
MRTLSVLAGPSSALHRNRERIQAATFGTFDGATSSYGGHHHAGWHAPPAGQRAALPSSRRTAAVSTATSGARLGSDKTVICSVPA